MSEAERTARTPGFEPLGPTTFRQHSKRIEQLLAEGMHDGKAWKPEAFSRYNELEFAEAGPASEALFASVMELLDKADKELGHEEFMKRAQTWSDSLKAERPAPDAGTEPPSALQFWDGQRWRFCPACQSKAFDFAEAYARAARSSGQSDWIAVEKSSPESSGDYLVARATWKGAELGFYVVAIKFFSKQTGWADAKGITHWMPLPAAPAESAKGE